MQRVQKTASVKHLNAESYHKKKLQKHLFFYTCQLSSYKHKNILTNLTKIKPFCPSPGEKW